MKYGVGVILQKEDKFLMQLRDDKNYISNPNVWAFFGGTLERGENPVDGAVREVKEELNLDLEGQDLRYVAKFYLWGQKGYLYKTPLKKELSDLELREGRDMKLFSRAEIMGNKQVWLPAKLCFLIYWNRIK